MEKQYHKESRLLVKLSILILLFGLIFNQINNHWSEIAAYLVS